MFLLSLNFLGLLLTTTLILFGGGGRFQPVQGLSCWNCRNCDPVLNPGKSEVCTGDPTTLHACMIEENKDKDPILPITTITVHRSCCTDCQEYEMEECTDKHGFNQALCFCNSTDNCNKDQISGVPAAADLEPPSHASPNFENGMLSGLIIFQAMMIMFHNYFIN